MGDRARACMAARLARHLQRSLCSDAARKPCSDQLSGGGGLLLVPEVERLTFISRTKRFKVWIPEIFTEFRNHMANPREVQHHMAKGVTEMKLFWIASELKLSSTMAIARDWAFTNKGDGSNLVTYGLTGEDGDEKLQAGAEIAFRQIAKLAEDDKTDWKEQLFIGPDLRTRIADQCADWRAAGYKPVIDIQEITCEVLAPLPGPVSKPGYGPTSKPSALWFSLLWIANCAGLADHSIALNVPILITAKGGSLKLVKIDAEPEAAAETDAEPAAAAETDAESAETPELKQLNDVARLNALLGVEHDEVVHKLQENIELTDELPIGDTMEASLGNNVWIFSCVPRIVFTMSGEDYEWKLTDINGAVNPMPRIEYPAN